MKNKLLLIALFVPLLLIGCSTSDDSSSSSSSSDTSTSESSTSSESSSGSSSSSSSSSVIHVTSVSLNKSSLTIDTSDGPTSLVATVLPATATNKNLIWSSSNTSVASVNNGTITPLSEGTTTITVTTVDGSKTDSCQVTVTDIDPTPGTVPVSSISLNHTGQYITIGSYFYLTPTILPSNATNKNVTWKSDKLGVATVISSGKVTGVGIGKCTITATTQDGNKVATCVVLVSDTSVPPYYLYGTIGGQSYIYGDYDYPGILDVTNYYIFYDVPLYEGDRLSVYDYTGHYLTDYYTDDPYVYVYHAEHKIVNIRLYVLSYNHNYLTIIE